MNIVKLSVPAYPVADNSIATGDETSSVILTPRRPTWKRARQFARSDLSIYRCLLTEALQGRRLEGRTLDIGGGKEVLYRKHLTFAGPLETLNINPRVQPDHLVDANNPLPFADAIFDSVISIDTFEHLYRYQMCVKEAVRILKPNGQLLFSVPFLYPIHGTPADFTRHTSDYWLAWLQELGMGSVVIEPLVFGPIATAHALLEKIRGFRRARLVSLAFTVLQAHRQPHEERMRNTMAEFFSRHAMGYVITCRKNCNHGKPGF